MDLPDVLIPDQESDPFLQRAKKRAANGFSLTRQISLENAYQLSYWLHVFRKDSEAIQCAELLAQCNTENKNLWSWAESALALEAYLLMTSQKDVAKAQDIIGKINDVGFAEARLSQDDNLIDYYESEVLNAKGKAAMREWRQTLLKEQTFIYVVGGSKSHTLDRVAQDRADNLAELRSLLGVAE